MSTESPRIYLASQSPRRRELLHQIGVEIAEVLRDLAVDETAHSGETPEVYVRRVAQAKAKKASTQIPKLTRFFWAGSPIHCK